ncbi:hypothetical protein MSAN_00967100 [Mycena sanguinolenta]|uniref:DUF6535 domain-containing protein n=1 Tax=Mycena sanguinolenta TaxID=230812 RepID=A0A8H7DBT8_9AGAR|nr:hypothetical protein MSAN_00967100 [Mycena sanguinolenta]
MSLPLPSFTASPSSVTCNGLWFISLGLSLACALIATFVQQWAREFLHKADMRSAPIVRARIFSYLYYGLKRFQMHTVVEIIPLLLHTSLLLFFCGLVAFLVPVNLAMAIIAADILAIVAVVYCVITFLPLCYLDCPYRTPLSGLLWRTVQYFQTLKAAPHSVSNLPTPREPSAVELNKQHDETLVEAMCRIAAKFSKERSDRDFKALVWTMKSLTDNVALEPFVEAIPDLLWGPDYRRRRTYDHHIRGLVHNPEVYLLDRILDFLQNCYTGALPTEVSQRRIIASHKAFWAIASLSDSDQSSGLANAPPLDLSQIYDTVYKGPLGDLADSLSVYSVPAATMILWSMFCTVRNDLLKARDYLASSEDENNLKLDQVVAYLWGVHWKFRGLGLPPFLDTPSRVALQSTVHQCLSEVPHRIIIDFLTRSVCLASPPYHWEGTRATIRISSPVPVSLRSFLEIQINKTISSQIGRSRSQPATLKMSWIEDSILELLFLWQPDDTYHVPSGVIELLNHWPSVLSHPDDDSLLSTEDIKSRLWDCFRGILLSQVSAVPQEYLTAMWQLACIGLFRYVTIDSSQYPGESTLDALSMVESPFPLITCSVIALLKAQVLSGLTSRTTRMMAKALNHHLFPADSGMQLLGELPPTEGPIELSLEQQTMIAALVRHRVAEARLDILAEYLENCSSDVLPFKVVETVSQIFDQPRDTFSSTLQARIHQTHQLRLANSIHSIFTGQQKSVELRDGIVNCMIWDFYANNNHAASPLLPNFRAWLDNPAAQRKIRDAFTEYETEFTTESSGQRVLQRLQRILRGIDFWHRAFDSAILPDRSITDGFSISDEDPIDTETQQ